MINSDSFVIYFHPGAYGTFVEWCLNFFTSDEFDKELPFNCAGSSHNFFKPMAATYHVFDNLANLGNWESSLRVHPSAVSKNTFDIYCTGDTGPLQCMKDELDYIYNNYTKKIVVLYFNMESVLTGLDNNCVKTSFKADSAGTSINKETMDKIFDDLKLSELERKFYFDSDVDDKIKIKLTLAGADQHASKWGHEKITDLDRWELREFISLYQIEAWASQHDQSLYDQLQDTFKDIIFVEIKDLESNFKQLIPDIINKFELPFVNQDQLDTVYTNWISRQQFANRNALVKKIVNHTVNNEYFDFSDAALTLYDEAIIQKLLRDQGLELKCFNLNVFPTNTTNLRKITSE